MAGMNREQVDSTEFHLGQGEDGKEDSLTDLLFPALSSKSPQTGTFLTPLKFFEYQEGSVVRFPALVPIPGTGNLYDSVCESGIYSATTPGSPPGTPPIPI